MSEPLHFRCPFCGKISTWLQIINRYNLYPNGERGEGDSKVVFAECGCSTITDNPSKYASECAIGEYKRR